MSSNRSNNQPTELWDNLVTTALLGTERRPLTRVQANEALGTALAQFDPNDKEHTLLGVSALLLLYQQAGMVPAKTERPEIQPSAPDEKPICSSRAAQHLAIILHERYDKALPEWLEALAQAGQRVPETMLPPLLDFGRTHEEIHPLLPAVIGKRGHWIATQKRAWRYASVDIAVMATPEIENDETEAALAEQWENNGRTQRMALLRQLRQQRPDKARELLLTTWPQEKASDRVDFLETFSTGLSQTDEPFLENALDDRSQKVREAAVGLLRRLPESRLVQRMIERVVPVFNYTATPEPKLTIEIALLEKFDAAMKRDQIVETSPHTWGSVSETGKKAWWLRQMLEAIPPNYWTNVWDASPQDILAAAARSYWNWETQNEYMLEAVAQINWNTTILIGAWAMATVEYADPVWAKAFLEERAKPISRFTYETLFELLPPEQRESYLIPILQKDTDIPEELIRRCRHRWSPALTRAILQAVRRVIEDDDSRSQDKKAGYSILRYVGTYMPTDMLQELIDGWPYNTKERERLASIFQKCTTMIRFRQEMLKELAQ